MSTEESELMDRETVYNLNEMEYHDKLLKLLEALSVIQKSANDGVAARPETTSEAAWMGAKLGEIHEICRRVIKEITNG